MLGSKNSLLNWLLPALLLFLAASCASSIEEGGADMVLLNGRITTLDPGRPEVEAIAMRDGLVLAAGTKGEIEDLIAADTSVIDLKGRRAVPGFVESHAHLLGLGTAAMRLDLVGTASIEEIKAMVRKQAAGLKAGQWILGRGWDQNDWKEKAFPTFEAITEAAPENPVFLTRIDGHAGWANRLAMERAGLTRQSKDPTGGRIIRDGKGAPTGVLIDNAMNMVSRAIPPMSRAEKKQAILAGIALCSAHGITSFHDAGAGAEVIDIYREILNDDELDLRLYVMLSGDDEDLLEKYYARGPEKGSRGLLTIRATKLFADGALGSRGAAMIEPYSDEPGHRGLMILTEDQLYEKSKAALAAGFQVCTHAIGDNANRATLNAYERAFRALPEAKDHRFRIEHAQILHKNDIPRFAELKVIPAMQPTHCTSDMPWVADRIGEERAEDGAYVWRKLLESGVPIPAGSDAPVESINPLWGFYSAITRKDHAGNPPGGWYPDQCMTREEALRAFTLDGAFAAFEEEMAGSLEASKRADVVVLSRDILTIPDREILEARVDLTVLGGRVVHER
jgi:predicted amidohydrolase YtcJ